MGAVTIVAYALLALGVLAIAQGAFALCNGLAFRRYVQQELARAPSGAQPRAAVFLPCKGWDDRLADTLAAVTQQDYPDYEVVCAVESKDDPAWEIIERVAARFAPVRMRCVSAQPAEGCSQKIANLLAALAVVDSGVQIYAFLDSDAVPNNRWLASLVEPLADTRVGACTGYRWYVPSGSWVSLLRCVWNASTMTFLGNHGRNFCWGGSTAIRRETFERLGIVERWRRVLSEDYELTRTVRAVGLRIHFAPRCVIPSDDSTTWKEFWRFARRQMLITRVCHPKVWTAGAVMALVFNAAFWGLLALGMAGPPAFAVAAFSEAAAIYGLSAANGIVRQAAVSHLFPERTRRRGAGWADAMGAPLVGLFNLALAAASALSRRFWWRGVLYEMKANDQVTIIRRLSGKPSSERQT